MTERYSKVAVVLHWLVALGILVNLWIGLRLDDTPKDQIASVMGTHKSVGITVLLLALMRLLWRVSHKPPAMLPMAGWERTLASAVHHLLYLLMVLVPLLGWLLVSASKKAATTPLVLWNAVPWFYLPAPQTAHEIFEKSHGLTAWILLGAVALHIAGALKHQFVDKQPEIQRMLP